MRERRPSPVRCLLLVALVAGLVQGSPQGMREIEAFGNHPNTTSSSTATKVPYPAGNSTQSTGSGTGTAALTGSPASATASTATTTTSNPQLPTLPSQSNHISYHASGGAQQSSEFPQATGTGGIFFQGAPGTTGGAHPPSEFPQATGTGGIFFHGGAPGTTGGAMHGTNPTGTGFPQLTGLQKGPRVSGLAFGTGSGISGGYGPSGSGASGSINSWARNPKCTASWNSRFSAANGTVMTTKTYSYTMTLTDKTISTFRPGEVATGPTTAVFNAGTVTYQVGSDDMCCGDCNILYPNVRVYYWPTNNTNTWCLKGQTTIPAGTGGVLDPGLPNLPTLPSLPSLTSTGPVGETTGPLAFYSGIPPGGFGAERRARDVEHKARGVEQPNPTITPPPKLPRSFTGQRRPAHQLEARSFIGLGGPGGLRISPGIRDPTLNDTSPLVFPGVSSNLTFNLGNSSNGGLHKEVIDVVDGMTFVSPTVYVVISTIQAKDKCGTVGGVHTSLTLSYAKDQLSTVDAFGETSSFNFADLPCPPSSWAFPNPLQGNTAALQNLADSYHPRILVPHTALQNLDKAWQSCYIIDVGQGYDPPRQLTPQTVMASTTPAADLPLCSDGGKADPNGIYAENTASHCLETASIVNKFPQKAPDYKSKDPFGLVPASVNLAQGDPSSTPAAPVFAPMVAESSPVAQQPKTNGLVPPPASPAPNPPVQSPHIAIPQPAGSPVQNPPAQTPPAQAPPAQTPQSVVVGGQTVSEGAPSINVGGKSVALSKGNIIVGSSTAPAPVQQPAPTDSTAPIVAGGLTLTPASTNPPAAPEPSPVAVNGLTFSAPQVKAVGPASPAAQPAPAPVVAGGITYQPVAPQPSQPPVTVGGLTLTPVQTQGAKSPQQPQAPAVGAPGQTGASNIVVGGQTYAAGVPAAPASTPVVQNGVTVAPVPAGAPASTPLGVVGGEVVTGSAKQAVVAGQTLSAGGAPVTIHGTPVSLGSSNIVIGSSTAALPTAAPSAIGTVAGQVISGGSSQAIVAGQTISAGGPPVTISGTPVSLGSSAGSPAVVIGGSTAPLPTSEPSPLGVVGGQVINGNSKSAIVDGQTVSAGGPPVTVHGTPVSLGGSNIVIGTSTAPLPVSSAPGDGSTDAPLGVVAGQVISGDKSHAVVDGQTILPGSVATISGTPVSLGSSNIVIGTNSVPLPTDIPGGIQSAGPSAFSIGGSVVSNGGAPITVSGTRISLGPSGLVVGSSTVPLTGADQMAQSTGPPVYSIDGLGVTQGSPAVTVSGTRISLGSSAVVIGSSTIAFPTTSAFSVGGQVFTPQAGGFSIDGTTLTPGGPGVTVSGTAVSIDASSNLHFGSSTIALPAGPSGSPTLAVAGQTLTALPKSLGGGYVDNGVTITPGGAPVTISGTPVSLNTASSLVIGSTTVPLASAGPGDFYGNDKAPLTADGETFTPLGPSSVGIDGLTLSVSGSAITDHGTIISLASGGLVVGSSTFAYATPASNDLTSVSNGPVSGQGATPSVFTIDGETFTAEPSGLAIGSTDLSMGGSPVTVNGTVISLASNSLVVGASTIPLASVTGLSAAIAAATASAGAVPTLSGPAGAGPTKTGKNGKSSAAGKLKVADLQDWQVMVGLGLLTGVVSWIFLI